MCDKLLKIYTKEDDIVYDPFMGTGTTGVACNRIKRNFIGSEISEQQVEYSKERILNIWNDLLTLPYENRKHRIGFRII